MTDLKAPDSFVRWCSAHRLNGQQWNSQMDEIYAAAVEASGLGARVECQIPALKQCVSERDVTIAQLETRMNELALSQQAFRLEVKANNALKARVKELTEALEMAADVCDFYGAEKGCANARAVLQRGRQP